MAMFTIVTIEAIGVFIASLYHFLLRSYNYTRLNFVTEKLLTQIIIIWKVYLQGLQGLRSWKCGGWFHSEDPKLEVWTLQLSELWFSSLPRCPFPQRIFFSLQWTPSFSGIGDKWLSWESICNCSCDILFIGHCIASGNILFIRTLYVDKRKKSSRFFANLLLTWLKAEKEMFLAF